MILDLEIAKEQQKIRPLKKGGFLQIDRDGNRTNYKIMDILAFERKKNSVALTLELKETK